LLQYCTAYQEENIVERHDKKEGQQEGDIACRVDQRGKAVQETRQEKETRQERGTVGNQERVIA